jgi:hypothetical protein
MTIEAYPSPNGVLTSLIWRFTATGSETSLSGYDDANQALSYTPGQEQVYLNGILLVRGEDYTATNGTSITGLTALAASDYIQVNCYNNFSVASFPASGIVGEVPVANIPSTIARVASPTFTGVPAAPTASTGTDTTQIATTAFVQTAVNGLIDAAPTALNTLNELAAALGDDANYASTVTTALSEKASLTGSETLTNKTLTDPKINQAITANTSTSYTLVLTDNNKIVTSNNASAQTISIPTNASVAFPVGARVDFAWITGAGQPTITAASSGTTTILSTGATSTSPKLRVVNSMASAVKIATDTWLVTGDVS